MKTPNPDNNKINEYQSFLELLEYEEYYLIKDNNIYKIILGVDKSDIIIKSSNYLIKLNLLELNIVTSIEFNSLNEGYEFIKNLFDENKITLKEIILKESIKLSLKIVNDKEIEIILKYSFGNRNYIFNTMNSLKKEIIDLKTENKKLKNEINKLKSYHLDPKNIKFTSNVAEDSYAHDNSDNSLNVFNSINNDTYLVYSKENKSIICYDLDKKQIIKEIKDSHKKYITNFRHHLDTENRRDLIMSISYEDNNLKVWDVTHNWQCILNLEKVNDNGRLYSACFLSNINKSIYIITSNLNYGKSENIKVFDFNLNKIKEIDNSNYDTFFIDTYYDNALNKNYLITGNVGCVKSYDYNMNEIFHIYSSNNGSYHISAVVKSDEEKKKLIESCNDGHIRIWDFHLGEMLNKIKVSDEYLFGICLINNKHLCVGCEDKKIKIINLNNEKVVKTFNDNNNNNGNYIISIKKIICPEYGVCLVTQGFKKDKIKLWTFQD